MKDYTVFDFYLGDDQDNFEKYWQVDNLVVRPMVGEKMSFWSTRDERGNYAHSDAEKMFEGIVTRIEHTIEERGRNAQECHRVHFVEVFLKPITP
jgi:hypothetical protein